MIYLHVKPEYDYVDTNSPGGWPRGKTAYVCEDDKEADLVSYINCAGYNNLWPSKASNTVFVSSESTLPRDALRNSGYKITRDIFNADYAIIPSPKACTEYAFNIIATYKDEEDDKNTACIYTISFVDRNMSHVIDETKREAIKGMIAKDIELDADKIDFICANDLSQKRIWFLPKCEEYEMIATNEKGVISGDWITDDRVELTPSINISIETLITWAAADSDDLLRKAIMQSDWKKYPFTVCSFLAAENQYINGGNGYFRDILGAIHFNEFNESKIMTDVTISPEDYKMAAAWAMYRFGAEENGVVKNPLDGRQKAIYSMFLAKRTIIKPIPMQNSLSFENVINSAKNMSS